MMAPKDTTIHATLFNDFRSTMGRRVVYADWAQMLEALDASTRGGAIRFGVWANDDRDSPPEALPGGIRVLFLLYPSLPEWLLARLTQDHAYLVLDQAILVLPVRADDHDDLARELGRCVLKSWLLTAPLDEHVEERGGAKLFVRADPVASQPFRRKKGTGWQAAAREPALPPQPQAAAATASPKGGPAKRPYLVRLAAQAAPNVGHPRGIVASAKARAGVAAPGPALKSNTTVSKGAPFGPLKKNTSISKYVVRAASQGAAKPVARSTSASRMNTAGSNVTAVASTAAIALATPPPRSSTQTTASLKPQSSLASAPAPATPPTPRLQHVRPSATAKTRHVTLPVRPPGWTPMIPSVAVEPLALILAGNCRLHGTELRSNDEPIGRFHGTRTQLADLSGATTHRIVRALLHFQFQSNQGEVVGGVSALARLSKVQPARAKRSLDALKLLELEGSSVLQLQEVRRARAHVLRITLKGPFASGYFSSGRVKQSTKGRRVVPVSSAPPPTTSNDTAMHEMSLHMLLMGELRERGDRTKEYVWVEVDTARLHWLSDLAGLSMSRAKQWLRLCNEQSVLLAEEVEQGLWLVAVTAIGSPSAFKALYEGLHLTQSARLHRRGRRLTYTKRKKLLAAHSH